ncbi:MAG: type II methionyl aminopeptidase [Candidatus Hecatellales archaeon]|nr:MAG: type II methionyl aminopeptidase [Candidatus Hecatellales archaeon]
MLDEEEVEKLRLAGRIASQVRRWAEGRVKPGKPLIELCEEVEGEIRRRGGEPAFPCNLDINEVGAHYTPPPGEGAVIPEGALVKVDIGVHVEGYIADTAVSVCLSSEYGLLKEAAEEALEAGIETMKAGVKVSEVGFAIQKTIERLGLKPIRNLTGHSIGRYLIHTGKHIPNVGSMNGLKVEPGELYALEPFVTLRDAAGEVVSGPCGNIYRVSKRKLPKNGEARRLMQEILDSFSTLPFTFRWLTPRGNPKVLSEAFNLLLKQRYISCYSMLIERTGKPVAQAEHTVLVLRDGVEVLTR